MVNHINGDHIKESYGLYHSSRVLHQMLEAPAGIDLDVVCPAGTCLQIADENLNES